MTSCYYYYYYYQYKQHIHYYPVNSIQKERKKNILVHVLHNLLWKVYSFFLIIILLYVGRRQEWTALSELHGICSKIQINHTMANRNLTVSHPVLCSTCPLPFSEPLSFCSSCFFPYDPDLFPFLPPFASDDKMDLSWWAMASDRYLSGISWYYKNLGLSQCDSFLCNSLIEYWGIIVNCQ